MMTLDWARARVGELMAVLASQSATTQAQTCALLELVRIQSGIDVPVEGPGGPGGIPGGGGGASVGVATLDFGATPTDQAQVVVTGVSAVQTGSDVRAAFMRETTVDNGVEEHEEASSRCPLTCGDLVPGVGFTIFACPVSGLATGSFKVRWSVQ